MFKSLSIRSMVSEPIFRAIVKRQVRAVSLDAKVAVIKKTPDLKTMFNSERKVLSGTAT